MENTKNNMPENAQKFFTRLQNYLDTTIYYYGSIQRFDYISDCSDIDAAIFTENFDSTILKLQNFLNEKRSSFKKFVLRLECCNKVAYGYKIKYQDKYDTFTAEIAIYSEKIKDSALKEQLGKCDIPFYVSLLLYILKTLYYRLQIIPFKTFISLKRYCINILVNGKDTDYILL